jgi:biopolymer transport protein ExbB
VELARQPEGKYLGFLEDFEESTVPEILPMGVDPSRGVLLGMLVNAPSFMERFHQGGLVGYIITILLFVGVIIVGERFYVLKKEKDKIMAQLGHSHIDESNALGRLLKVFEENKTESLENLELKLDESIMKSLPPIEKGIGTLKLLAAIGPLMGLLGTVTGMITTFQSITMFGAGDPKLMAGGISTALITTVQGLVCAIPMLLLHGYISGKSKEIVQILTEQSVGLIAEKKGK